MKIYTLSDQTGVRYVGVTSRTLSQRLYQHVYSSKRCKGRHVSHWIQSLLLKGERPVIQLIEECPDQIWEIREMYWIAELRKQGCQLTNASPGGVGVVIDRKVTSIERSASAKHKPVYNTDLLGNIISVFPSIKEAVKITGVSKGAIGNALRAQTQAGKCYWFYKGSEISITTRKRRNKKIEVVRDSEKHLFAGITAAAEFLKCCRSKLSKALKSDQQYVGWDVRFIN